MKKYINVIFVTLSIACVLPGCKKSTDNPPKDYAASINDKTWWGTLIYTGKTQEYYSVHFNAGNTLIWSQLSGDTQGQWTLDGKVLTITFTGNTVEIKATISDDDKLINIGDNTPNSEITSGQLIITPNVYLDNTQWKGSFPHNSQPFLLSFKSALQVEEKSNGTFGPYNYVRVMSGAAIRFSSAAFGGQVFGVIISNTEMRGNITAFNYEWKIIKQ